MTDTTEIASAAPKAANTPFNLIVAPTRAIALKIAEHFDLPEVRILCDVPHLPEGGAKRGEAITRLLDGTAGMVTLVTLQDRGWLESLLDDMQGMAPMVWRSIESSVLGHRTDSQRNFLVVAGDFEGGIREAEEAGLLRKFVCGVRVPETWKAVRAARPVVEKPVKKNEATQTKQPVAAQPKKPATSAAVGKAQESPRGTSIAPYAKSVGTGPQGQKSKVKPNANSALHDDLYLLSKGFYGPVSLAVDPESFELRVREIIRFHIGTAQQIPNEVVCTHLVRAFVSKASRATWRAFDLIQELAIAGGEGPHSVITKLGHWLGMIPARDGEGKIIPQPTANDDLFKLLADSTTRAQHRDREIGDLSPAA
jgi:hypothetical protein